MVFKLQGNKKAIVFAFLHQQWLRIGAADEARTRYLHLGKVALYQMSYGRISGAFIPAPSRFLTGPPQKLAKQSFAEKRRKSYTTFDVVPPIGIEPMTRGFSVPCSTD